MMKKIHLLLASLFLLFLSHTLNSQINLNIIGDTIVGEPITFEAVAFHLGGVDEVRILIDGDLENGQFMKDCNGAMICTLSITITQDYIGSKTVWASMQKKQDGSFERTSTILDFKCDQEYCPPDPLMDDFFQWMRKMKYPECITSRYIQFSADAEFRNGGRFLPSMKSFLSKRHIFEDTTIVIDFIDVIPTDTIATYKGLSEGEADLCTPNPTWPEVCPKPVTADYIYLQAYLRKTFGINLILNYIRKEINYSEVIGTPNLVSGKYQFPFLGRRAYISQFATNSIVHWAIHTYDGKSIADMTGANNLAEIEYEPSSTTGLIATSHEWGHSLGLRNSLEVLPHPFQTRNGQRAYFQIDGIMSNTYKAGTGAQDPLDPMERYALEPPMGFLYSATFVQRYFDGIIGWSSGLNVCDSVDVAIEKIGIINQTNNAMTVQFEIRNANSQNTGFLNVGLLNNQQEIIEMRTVEFVNFGGPISMNWTIDNCDGEYFIVIDPLNKIVEKTKNNNVISFNCISTSTTSQENEIQFHIYPNPTSGLINIRSIQANQKGSINIFNMKGLLIESLYFNEKTDVSLSHYPAGLYLIQIQSEDYVVMRKIMKK